ncbi:ElaA protein [Nonlabens dokdonensis]|jgi:ElaA protein|uniref:ElaA-like GNAT family acetyltransferase n=2 Tax=Nonlabens dokdonensis TaxID=328515 RepID=L7W4J3_NONDD|nr:GNAT family N-acetyltransferase [Nonlabens dokdonensis]AGC76530.1 ElaA-like GNAT family acetyltransferase [Nonlabens dokdonensis DSW-6]PZX44181.1 ElaA protein [Nonlabens dokdonensis]
MKTVIKSFNEFSIEELYAVLRLRSEVFVVEQDCVYQDIDDKDQKAIHILGYEKEHIAAYTRIFKPGDYFEQASIGRVVVSPSQRGKSFGKDIMLASLAYAKAENFPSVKISAQCYLDKFYTDLGFISTGEKYLEDGIPHQAMVLVIK